MDQVFREYHLDNNYSGYGEANDDSGDTHADRSDDYYCVVVVYGAQ